ncbi:minor capsid protein [Enterococcus hirae]
MDLWERVADSIDSVKGLPMPCMMGFLNGEDTLCVYTLPGSRTIEEYFDGTREREMLFEVGFNTKDQEKANRTLWLISNHLEELSSLGSNDGSFKFISSEISDTPFVSEQDNQGLSTYLLDIKINIHQFSE